MPTFDVYALAFVAPRKGVSTPALLVTLTIALLLAAAAIDLAQLSHQRHQIQIGADAAVLAAAPLLHDDLPLYLGPEGTTPDIDAPALRLRQLEAAQEQAILFAGLNRVANCPIILEPVGDGGDLNDQDLLFGFTLDPAMEDLTGEPAKDGSFNSLVVRASRRKAAGDLPLLWMARQVGLENLEMKVYSQAVIDQRLYGFRPLAHVPVPVLPIAVLPELTDLMMFPDAELTHLWWAKGPHDHYIVDPLTRSVDHGSDGIAEMVIRIHDADSGTPANGVKTRQGALVGFGSGDASPAAIAHFSQFGLTSDDLPGGQIAIAEIANPPLLPAVYNAESADLADICEAIRSAQPPLIGTPRILPIGAETGDSSVGIVGFVAGTIVDCEQDSDGSLLLIVQPCLLQSPTALVGGENPRNPWIGKLLLNR